MDNFDFTQFISFDTDLPYNEIESIIINLFERIGFSLIPFDDIKTVKKEYYCEYWRKYNFELKKDDFLSDFMDWKCVDDVPEQINVFVQTIDELLGVDIRELRLIICSFAEKTKTKNEVVCINRERLLHELFKMSIFSFKCPDNLIINIID